jgi:hypothetical protein
VKSIVTTYPDFQSLPKGVKKMLVTSESFFFGEANTAPKGLEDAKPNVAVVLGERRNVPAGQTAQTQLPPR